MQQSTRYLLTAILGLVLVLSASLGAAASTAMQAPVTASALLPAIILPPIVIDTFPPTLSYLYIEPASCPQTSTATKVVITAKFSDPSQPVEATATLSPPSGLIIKAIGPTAPIISPVPRSAKFAAPTNPLPVGAPTGCVQAVINLPSNAKLGDWLLSLEAADAKKNKATWLSGDLKAAGKPYRVTVTAAAAPPSSGDTKPPLTVASGLPEGWSNQPVLIELMATDDAESVAPSGVKGTFYKIGGGDAQPYSTAVEVSTPGKTTFSFWSVDNANNTEPAQTLDVLIDSTPPTLTCDVQPSYPSSATITVTCEDGDSGLLAFAYSVDGGEQVSVQLNGMKETRTVKVNEPGEHSLVVALWDLAQNEAQVAEMYTFTVGQGSETPSETIPPGEGEFPPGEEGGFTPAGDAVTLSDFPANGIRTVKWGGTTTIAGTLSRTQGEVAGVMIGLESLKAGVGTPIREVEVGENGAFSLNLAAPKVRTAYRLAFGEAYGLTPIYSKTFVLLPNAKITLASVPTSIKKGSSIRFKGTLAPTHGGKPIVVRIERQNKAGQWVLAKSLPAKAPGGKYAVSYRFGTVGSYRVCAKLVSTDTDHAPTATGWKKFRVRK